MRKTGLFNFKVPQEILLIGRTGESQIIDMSFLDFGDNDLMHQRMSARVYIGHSRLKLSQSSAIGEDGDFWVDYCNIDKIETSGGHEFGVKLTCRLHHESGISSDRELQFVIPELEAFERFKNQVTQPLLLNLLPLDRSYLFTSPTSRTNRAITQRHSLLRPPLLRTSERGVLYQS